MKLETFFAEITGKRFHFTRTDLATMEVKDEIQDVTPSRPSNTEVPNDSSSITIGRIRSYHRLDQFSFDDGVYIAVLINPSGRMFCDRLVSLSD